ncbi:hypothetical protein ACROYT_G040543 [Oculina patagonica]
MFRASILFVLVSVALGSGGAPWYYGKTVYGPSDWKDVSEHCSETAQSPINIEDSSAKEDPNLKGLSFTCDNENGFVSGNIANNGHAPTLAIDKPKGTATLTGGPLGDSKYKLQQLHFHFGCQDNKGSEHTVDGKAYSGELHLVTYNTKYSDFNTAASKDDGLAVIGVFIKGPEAPSHFPEGLLDAIRKIRKTGAVAAVENLSLYNLVPQLKDLSAGAGFYSYKGSLTTPPCYQSVNWIVLKNPISVGKKVLGAMRRLHNAEKHSMCDNFRPTQPLNGRTVSENSG